MNPEAPNERAVADRAPTVWRGATRSSPGPRPAAPLPVADSGMLAAQLAEVLVNLFEFGDPYYRGGTSLTRAIAESVCDHFFIKGAERHDLLMASVLRDLGRLLMQSRGQLRPMSHPTPQHQKLIERHVTLTLEILGQVDLPDTAREIIRHHHERWDGQGYPDGLRGEEIPLGARILAVADSIASMLRPRPYRLPRRFEEVAEELKEQSGRQFDPAVVSAVSHILRAGGFRLLGLGERQHVLVAYPSAEEGDMVALQLSRLGYLAEVRALGEVRDRALRVPVEAVVLSAAADPILCQRVIEDLRRTPNLRDTTILVTGAPDAPSRGQALGAGADVALGVVDFETLRQMLAAMISQSVRHRRDRPLTAEQSMPAMTGRIEEFGVDWLLQWLNYNGSTAAVELDHRGLTGTVWIQDGEPHHAEMDSLVGVEALRHLIGWQAGRFIIRMGHEASQRTIESSLVSLLLRFGTGTETDAVLYGAVEGRG